MKMKQTQKWLLVCSIILCGVLINPQTADAHGGRRFEIQVLNNQLIAQGVNTGHHDDGGGAVRPYYNAIHDHWLNLAGGDAIATLPGFDVTPGKLVGESLVLELFGARKWVNPDPNVDPVLVDLADGEFIEIGLGLLTPIKTNDAVLGSLLLSGSVSNSGLHIDLDYGIDTQPTNTIYAIEWGLSAGAGSSLLPSDSIYTILAPQGSGHHQSALALERFLGVTAIPEPSAASLLGLMALVGLRRGRRVAKA